MIPRATKYGSEYFVKTGDLNNDNLLNILDIILLQTIILQGDNSDESQIQLGDMNDDGELNIIDIIFLINDILDI